MIGINHDEHTRLPREMRIQPRSLLKSMHQIIHSMTMNADRHSYRDGKSGVTLDIHLLLEFKGWMTIVRRLVSLVIWGLTTASDTQLNKEDLLGLNVYEDTSWCGNSRLFIHVVSYGSSKLTTISMYLR
ncbi:8493_t:CDS:2 [Cetraspora pellucida]|uniref:8493_t:CDS:1 n=1 Tax=Cetraspora pellucida TaxID=1433469 RepID=A0A9N8W2X7_9GLOM|nr:8493_t:CDS:2 [Cetraspora pellucida]